MDLRAEVQDMPAAERDDWLERIGRDWRAARLSALDRGLCEYAEKLSLAPAAMTEGDVASLRALGCDDVTVHDAIQVVSYFNYINRVADAVHVDLEPGMDPYPGSPASAPETKRPRLPGERGLAEL